MFDELFEIHGSRMRVWFAGILMNWASSIAQVRIKEPGELAKNIHVDEVRGIVTIFGQEFTGEFMECLSKCGRPDAWFKLKKDGKGGITLQFNLEKP